MIEENEFPLHFFSPKAKAGKPTDQSIYHRIDELGHPRHRLPVGRKTETNDVEIVSEDIELGRARDPDNVEPKVNPRVPDEGPRTRRHDPRDASGETERRRSRSARDFDTRDVGI